MSTASVKANGDLFSRAPPVSCALLLDSALLPFAMLLFGLVPNTSATCLPALRRWSHVTDAAPSPWPRRPRQVGRASHWERGDSPCSRRHRRQQGRRRSTVASCRDWCGSRCCLTTYATTSSSKCTPAASGPSATHSAASSCSTMRRSTCRGMPPLLGQPAGRPHAHAYASLLLLASPGSLVDLTWPDIPPEMKSDGLLATNAEGKKEGATRDAGVIRGKQVTVSL